MTLLPICLLLSLLLHTHAQLSLTEDGQFLLKIGYDDTIESIDFSPLNSTEEITVLLDIKISDFKSSDDSQFSVMIVNCAEGQELYFILDNIQDIVPGISEIFGTKDLSCEEVLLRSDFESGGSCQWDYNIELEKLIEGDNYARLRLNFSLCRFPSFSIPVRVISILCFTLLYLTVIPFAFAVMKHQFGSPSTIQNLYHHPVDIELD
eukprot:TRINITY_DN8143_c0_g1_i1.p1 TRINITY_DN8143_c0_g1~~TRINITY_DN8143_c0_g1_i1.p1  ORF type:complete len:222 (+),score=39.83 TRINITY_DN8143_c0_g1_i1:46-666(+)